MITEKKTEQHNVMLPGTYDIKVMAAQYYLLSHSNSGHITCFDHLNGHHLVFPRKGCNITVGCVHVRDPVVFTMWLISIINNKCDII